jgi:hypothetical protein
MRSQRIEVLVGVVLQRIADSIVRQRANPAGCTRHGSTIRIADPDDVAVALEPLSEIEHDEIAERRDQDKLVVLDEALLDRAFSEPAVLAGMAALLLR